MTRSMAYREPKKRQMWLKIWFNTLEKAEAENQVRMICFPKWNN